MTKNNNDHVHRRDFLGGAAFLGLAASGVPGSGSASSPSRSILSVRDFDAPADKLQDATKAFQAAIDACHNQGGGTVYVPPGDYACAGIELKSRVTLYLEAGATVYASRDPDAYGGRGAQLIRAKDAEQISILGPGVLHGQATEDLGRRPGTADEPRPKFRTRVIFLEDCSRVILRDFTILYSDSWACHLRRCEKVVVDGLTILNNYFRANSDGIDPESCRDVRISNCHITAGDDCICLKTTGGVPCEDIVVTNCTTESIATAIKLGTGSDGDFRNITIANCTVRNSTVGVGFYVKDGGTIEGVTVTGLTIATLDDPMQVNLERLRNMVYPIFVDVEKRRDDSRIGGVRDVIFSDICIRSDNGILIQGMTESPLENVTLTNVIFRVTRPFDYRDRKKHAGGPSNPKDDRITLYARQPSYCTIANARNVVLDNLLVLADPAALETYPRSAAALFNVAGTHLRSIHRTPSKAGGPMLTLDHVTEALVTGCLAPAGTSTFVELRGMARTDVALEANDLHRAAHAVKRAKGHPTLHRQRE